MAQAIGSKAEEGVVRRNFKKIVPQSYQFPDVRVGMDGDRHEIKLNAKHGEYATTGNRIVTFVIPNQGIVDFRQAYFQFDAAVTVTGGTFSRFAQYIWCAFDRLRIKASTAGELEDVRQLNLLQSMMYEIQTEADVSGSAGPIWGTGTTADRNGWGSGRDYAMPIFSGFLANGILPLKFVKDTLEIEFYLGDPTTYIETDGTNPVVTITNPKLIYDKLSTDISYEAAVSSRIASAGLSIGFKTFEHYQNAVTAANTSNQINHRADSVDAMLHVFRNQNDVNDPTIFDKFITYGKNNTTQYQAKINNEFHPEEPVVTTTNASQSYVNLLKYQRKWVIKGMREDPPTISMASYNATRFVMVNDLRAHMEEALINPKGNVKHTADMQLDVLMSVAPGVPLRLESFVQFHTVVVINKAGKLVRVF